jgi:transposase InsO family protein
LGRAVDWFAARGITIERVMTDNGNGYRSTAWARRCAQLGNRHTCTRPHRPATNGKAERFNRTWPTSGLTAPLWTSDASRVRALDPWLHRNNNHRHHTAIGGPPFPRVTNLPSYNN